MKQNQSFKKFMITSLVVHISLFALLLFFSKLAPPTDKKETVEISFIEEQKPVATKKVNIPDPHRIVETDSSAANEKVSENAKFLSEKNNTVEKETRAKTGEKFQNTKNAVAAQKVVKAQKAQKSTPQLFDEGFNAYASLNKQQVAEQKAQEGQLAAKESSSTNDSLPDVNETLITRLNTREYKYYTYYTRIKNQLNQWWVPKVKQKFTKMFKQGRTIASEESKITKLVIVLNTSGILVGVQVLAESGVRDLDDAAIEAFRSAAPFPNPPKGMIETDGTVKIRWDCVVES